MSGSYDTPVWRFLSALVTSGAKCTYCPATEDLVAHHKVPRDFGGSDALDNLEPVCRRCHPRAESVARARAILSGRRAAVSPRYRRVRLAPAGQQGIRQARRIRRTPL